MFVLLLAEATFVLVILVLGQTAIIKNTKLK